MACDTIRDFLSAYADNELSVESAVEVERHLQACPSCRLLVEQRRRFAETIGRLYPRASMPPALEDRIRAAIATPAAPRYWMSIVALAASLVLILAAWSLARRGQPSKPAAVVVAAQTHRHALAHELPLAVRSSDPAAVNAWLRSVLPFAVGDPVQAPTPDLVLQGAAVVNMGDEPVGYVQYGHGAQLISLLLLPPREWPQGEPPARVRNMDFHFYTVDGLKLIAWNHSPLSYVLVSDLGGRGTGACAVCHSGPADAALRSLADQGLI